MIQFDIPELTEVIKNLEEILANQKALSEQLNSMKGDSLPAWISLREACALKGVSFSTIQKPENRHLMPPLAERERVGKALKWPRSVILKWLLQKDDELEAVRKKLAKVQTTAATRKLLNPDEVVLKAPAPINGKVDEAFRLINEIQEQSKNI